MEQIPRRLPVPRLKFAERSWIKFPLERSDHDRLRAASAATMVGMFDILRVALRAWLDRAGY